MPANRFKQIAGDEPTYSRSVFEAILAGMGPDDPFREEFVCSADGARVREVTAPEPLAWHPLCEVMLPGSPNPLDEPWLPFPFTARQLAAFMTDGWGHFIQSKYGDWEDGPDEDELLSIGQLGGKAKEALRAAYAAYRHAVEMAPRRDHDLEARAEELVEKYLEARNAAIAREELREHRHDDAEYTARLARVNEAVADLEHAMRESRKAASLSHSRWRRAVVQHLLLPIEEVDEDCFESLPLRAVPPEQRAFVLRQLQGQTAYQDCEAGKAHWALICEQQRLEAELRRWQALAPTSVTEADRHEAKLKELEADLATIQTKLRALETSSEPSTEAEAAPANVQTPLDFSRLATRDQLVRAFGSFGLKEAWFRDLGSHPWLLEARRVKGQGARGSRREPWFCPYAVMTGLTKQSRESRLNVDKGWHLLKAHFPNAYAAVEHGDPRDPSG